MQARLAHYTVDPERIDEAIRGFEEAAETLRTLEGNTGGYLLVDRDEGRLITLTFWENHAALTHSEVRAARLRRRAMEGADGVVEAVQCFDVALDFSAVPQT